MATAKWGITAAVLVMLTHPGTSTAGDQVPYKDRVEAVIVDAEEVSPDCVALPFVVVRGQGTHVGRFTTDGELLVNLSTLEFIGTNTIYAANGDEIHTVIVGQLIPTDDPEVFVIALDAEFVGGTGRFHNATGGFSGLGELRPGEGGAFVGSTFAGIGEGTISSPGTSKKK